MAQRRAPRLIRIEDAAANLPPGLYPVRLSDGTRRRMRVRGGDQTHLRTEAGYDIPMLSLETSATPQDMARRITRGFATAQDANA